MDSDASDHLITRLDAIFPGLRAACEADPSADGGALSHHATYLGLRDFPGSCSAVHTAAARRQLARFADLLNAEVAAGGNAENAVATCFLEHLSPLPLRRALWPLLLPGSRASSRA